MNSTSATPQATPVSLFIMVGAGVGFLIWFAILMGIGLPTSNGATFETKRQSVLIGIVPALLFGSTLVLASFFYMKSASKAQQFIPLLIIPALSLACGVLALYFSLYQVTNLTTS